MSEERPLCPVNLTTRCEIRPGDGPRRRHCGAICYEAFATVNGQHGYPPDLPAPEAGVGLLGMMFSHPGYYCVVAEADGRIIGSNCLDERSAIAGIGPITVDPDVQNRSVGRRLMQAVLDRARERGFPASGCSNRRS